MVDSPAFQRLRRVHQLAMTYLVYPGARHSRFEHCIGACDVGGRLAESVNAAAKNQVVNVSRVRAAALCHDLGHGPFSHVGEFVFEELAGRSHVHEQISAATVAGIQQTRLYSNLPTKPLYTFIHRIEEIGSVRSHSGVFKSQHVQDGIN